MELELLLINSEPPGGPGTSNSSPSGTLWHWEEGGNPCPTRALCFCSKVSLWLLSFTYSLISRRSTGAAAAISVLCSAKVMGAKAGSSIMSLVTIHELLKLPQLSPLKVPCLLTLSGSCGVVCCSQNIRKYSPFAPSSFPPCSQDESIALGPFYSPKPSWSGCCLLPVFVPIGSCCCLCFWERSFRVWLRPLFKCCVWYQCFVFSFYT